MVTFAWTGHRRRLRLMVHGLLFLGWALVAARELAIWSAFPDTNGGAAAAALWVLPGLVLLWNALRKGAGRETLTVAPDALLHARAFGPFLWRRRFALDLVLRPRAVPIRAAASPTFRLEFDYRGGVRRIGSGLSASEAECLVALIRRAQGSGPDRP